MVTVSITLTQGQIDSLLLLASDLRAYFAKKKAVVHARGPQRNPHRRLAVRGGVTDPWVDLLQATPGEQVSSHDLLVRDIGLDPKRASPVDYGRLAACMRYHGWHGPKMMRIDGRAVRGYERSLEEAKLAQAAWEAAAT